MSSPQTDTAALLACAPSPAASAEAPSGGLRSSASIARQTSIYALTLEELQNVLGEPTRSFGSMNMDEFLKNIWTVEESQAMAAVMGGGGGAPSEGRPQGMQQQASISLPRTLSTKTVEDVMKDIVHGSINMESNPISGVHERQVTLGEMTLEDFLVQAGVVKNNDPESALCGSFRMGFENPFGAGTPVGDDNKIGDIYGDSKSIGEEKPRMTELSMLSLSGGSNMPISQGGVESMELETMNHVSPLIQPPEWFPKHPFKEDIDYTHPPMNSTFNRHALEVSARNGAMFGGPGVLGPEASLTLRAGSPQSPMVDGLTPPYDSMALHSPLSYGMEGLMHGRKRDFEGSLEKVVERRQKRMIKNRESAARSRARKQAYTVELEAEVFHLKEENMRLRRHEEEMAERRRRQLIDVLTSFGPKFKPKACRLRRTHTGPW